MESSCLSFITVCRKLLGISLESVVRVRWMDLLYARVIKVHAVCLRLAPMLGQSIQTAQCTAKPSLLLSPSLCSCSNSLSKYPSQHRLLPPSVLSPLSAHTTSRLLVKLLLRMKMGLSVVFLCEMNTWSGIVQPTSKISAVLEPSSIGYKWMLKCFLQ